METKEYKFQYSQSNGNGGILVVRTDNQDEVERLMGLADRLMNKEIVRREPVKVEELGSTSNHMCKKHNVEMKERSFNNKSWFDHRRKLDDGSWEKCNGFGFPSELRDSISESFENTQQNF